MIERSFADNDWNWRNIQRKLIEEEVISPDKNATVRVREENNVPYPTVCENSFVSAMTHATQGHEGRCSFFHMERMLIWKPWRSAFGSMGYMPIQPEDFLRTTDHSIPEGRGV
jgi:hypothetical protein